MANNVKATVKYMQLSEDFRAFSFKLLILVYFYKS